MRGKDEHVVVSNKYTFFESPFGNLERKTESEHTIKEPRVIYDPRFVFPASFGHTYSTVDNGGMESNLLSLEHAMPNDRIQNRILVRRRLVRNFENEMRLVEHYMAK